MRSIELWCAIAHLRISRFRVWYARPALRAVPADHPGMTDAQAAGRDEQERDPAQIDRAQIGCGGRP
ncbi:hypothetical protein D6B98_06225 [Bradyrhizobium sp. LVM 105]|uniref:Uncharacterized protein n=1 Tax=Bradyrhizobium frederickii TaxID=2560054 RepID=A0A4Y9LDU2_9BRAD|nr:hypothetical protein D6B98_06225 [Bradyrhizobium sp. LVM 105]TFV41568.1 hypothetical protein E4K66_04410 [Bradyrhizobium frederickii]